MPYVLNRLIAIVFFLVGFPVATEIDPAAGVALIVGAFLLGALGDINYELERMTRAMKNRQDAKPAGAALESAPGRPQGP